MSQLKQKRIAARIPGRLLCPRARITPARLSEIERGYCTASADELERIRRALTDLITAKRKVQKFARTVGWPME
jgi:hypothetical protein